ncbi:hypothetical protein IC575_010458 [Cucumis melo]
MLVLITWFFLNMVLSVLNFYVWVCLANKHFNTVFMAENAISGNPCRCTGYRSIADACKSLDVDTIQKVNMHTFDSLNLFFKDAGEPQEYILPSIWDRLATSSSLKQRTELVDKFNSFNTWKERGLSRIPIMHEVIF